MELETLILNYFVLIQSSLLSQHWMSRQYYIISRVRNLWDGRKSYYLQAYLLKEFFNVADKAEGSLPKPGLQPTGRNAICIKRNQKVWNKEPKRNVPWQSKILGYNTTKNHDRQTNLLPLTPVLDQTKT